MPGEYRTSMTSRKGKSARQRINEEMRANFTALSNAFARSKRAIAPQLQHVGEAARTSPMIDRRRPAE
jgi:hypothetical protein